MRRSFSHFARGWPGTGLLLIRFLIGLTVINHEVRSLLTSHPLTFSSAISVALIIGGILLIIGLWTPLAGVMVGVFELLNLIHQPDPWMCLRLALFASALAMVGPGGWSLDARLFGWKRLDVAPRAATAPETSPAE